MKKRELLIGLAALAVLALAACAATTAESPPADTPTAPPPTAEPSPEPPTATPVPPSPTPAVLVTDPGTLHGAWGSTGVGIYYKFLPDGTYHGDRCRRSVEDNPAFHGVYWFDGDRFHIREEEGWCAATGVYEIHLLESGDFLPVMIEDNCGPRRRNLAFAFEKRPPLE